jgi:alcohol dehydrogenase (cytochrome c)
VLTRADRQALVPPALPDGVAEVAGNFLALDAANGKILYKHNLGGPVAGGVVTYAVHGRQFVGVVTGNVSVFFNALSGVSVGGTPTVVVFALPEK